MNSLDSWNLWGTDNFGKIQNNGELYFYLKDHLGSIRAVLDEDQTVTSTQDYDMWGHLLEDRTSGSSNAKYDFTGKERDIETGYDYFGARYYDNRIGRWGGVEPFIESNIHFSPYSYCLNNSLNVIDPNGNDAFYLWFPNHELPTDIDKYEDIGHAGVLLVDNETGEANYYDFGEYDGSYGVVRNVKDMTKGEITQLPAVQYDKEGNPTEESLNAVLQIISENVATDQGPQKVNYVYIKSDKYTEMKKYAENRYENTHNLPHNDIYNVMTNNCAQFAMNTILQDGSVFFNDKSGVEQLFKPNKMYGAWSLTYKRNTYHVAVKANKKPEKSVPSDANKGTPSK